MRIVIVDDHPLYRSGVRNLVQTTDDLEIVGEAGTGEEAIWLAVNLDPELILMDIRLPDMDGIEATRRIRELRPSIHILILSMHKDEKTIFPAIKAGARGYLQKEADGLELLQAMRMVGGGSAVFSPDIASRMVTYFDGRPSNVHPILVQLTGREQEVLQWVTKGYSNLQIAQRLQISVKTVANNVTNILNKLHVADRNEARELVKSFEDSEL
jgi:Response regulator containing a CheY-like receiver domain and an HTH DNA-binding domain